MPGSTGESFEADLRRSIDAIAIFYNLLYAQPLHIFSSAQEALV